MKVPMKNPATGEIKMVKVGWSWVLFLFSGFLGLPLFLRRLNVWGAIFLALWAINLILPSMLGEEEGMIMGLIFMLIFLGLQIFLGIKGNEMTAKNYLELGWKFANPDDEVTKSAKMRWGITN